ncbi:Uncharacterized protein HZ326_30600 [Fusarium oxysporum f. sp. albedinis]|nr:Uncharacterized protein HZ326_30600 [Fusarium oxysporum f. sp. albedinis]
MVSGGGGHTCKFNHHVGMSHRYSGIQWDAKSIRRCAGRLDVQKLVRSSLSGPQYLILHLYQVDNLV